MLSKIREIKFSRLKPEIKYLYKLLYDLKTVDGTNYIQYYNEEQLVVTFVLSSNNLVFKSGLLNKLLDYSNDGVYIEKITIDVMYDLHKVKGNEVWCEPK